MKIQYQPEYIQDIVKKYGLQNMRVYDTISEEDGAQFEDIIMKYIKMGFNVKVFEDYLFKEEICLLIKALYEDKVINQEINLEYVAESGLYILLMKLFLKSKLHGYIANDNEPIDWKLVTRLILENELNLNRSEIEAITVLCGESDTMIPEYTYFESKLEGIDVKTLEVIYHIFVYNNTAITKSADINKSLLNMYEKFKQSNAEDLKKIEEMTEFQKNFLIVNKKISYITGLEYFSEELLNKKISSFQEFVLTYFAKDKQFIVNIGVEKGYLNHRNFLLAYYNQEPVEFIQSKRKEEEINSFQKWNPLLDARAIKLHGSKPPDTIYFNQGGFQKMFPVVKYLGNIEKIPREFYILLEHDSELVSQLLAIPRKSLDLQNLDTDDVYKLIYDWCVNNKEIINFILKHRAISFRISANKLPYLGRLDTLLDIFKYKRIKLKEFTFTNDELDRDNSYYKKLEDFVTLLDKDKEYIWEEITELYEEQCKRLQAKIQEPTITFHSNIFD